MSLSSLEKKDPAPTSTIGESYKVPDRQYGNTNRDTVRNNREVLKRSSKKVGAESPARTADSKLCVQRVTGTVW